MRAIHASILAATALALAGCSSVASGCGGDTLSLRGGKQGARLILVAGRPLQEPVARYGPFVMNTKEQVMQAFVDFQEGRF